MAQQKPQIFKAVVVRASEIQDSDIREQIEHKGMALELAKMEETKAQIALQNATADLLTARGNRMRAMAALQTAFGEGDTRVAMESNWDFFRGEGGIMCAENFLSERDQRNMMRAQRLQANKSLEQLNGDNHSDMFEEEGGQ